MNSWKLKHSDFISILNSSDILVLIETWKTNEKTKIIDADSDFIEYNVCRPLLKTAKCGSGGLTVLMKKQLVDCICYIESHKVGIIWFKIIREQSHAHFDIFLCCLYIPPKDSSRHVLNKNKNKNTFISEKKCNIIIIFIKYVTYNSFLETAIMGSAA